MLDQQCTGPLLVAKTGLSLSTVEKLMSGHLKPGRRSIDKIEKALGQRIWSHPALDAAVAPETIAVAELLRESRLVSSSKT
jgi:hypothetical protein